MFHHTSLLLQRHLCQKAQITGSENVKMYLKMYLHHTFRSHVRPFPGTLIPRGGGGGGDSGPYWTGCVNTILKEMGPFSASSEWHEWINFHSKWVSYWPGHSIWVPFAFITDSG